MVKCIPVCYLKDLKIRRFLKLEVISEWKIDFDEIDLDLYYGFFLHGEEIQKFSSL